jgi:PTS system ascorbate-specific IIA component
MFLGPSFLLCEEDMLLGEIISNNRVQFAEKAENWEEAIRMSCKLLIEDKTISPGYADEIIAAVHELGPYIVLMPGFALPHAMKGSVNVHSTAIAFMKLAQPVSFDTNNSEKDASVFFTLAARDSDEHLKNMRKLWKMLTNEELCADLQKVSSVEELMALDTKYSS